MADLALLSETHRPSGDPTLISREVFEHFPYGIVVAKPTGEVQMVNHAAGELLGDTEMIATRQRRRCCELFGCGRPGGPLEEGCLTELALTAGERLPEVRVDLATDDCPNAAAWVTAAPMKPGGSLVIFQLRPADIRDRRCRTTPHWIEGPQLRILALGRSRVDSGEGPIGGRWLEQRPGQLLKYLVCHRHRVAHIEEIAEAFWPAGDRGALNNVRHFIHALRDKLEPGRPSRAPSSFILAREGGYAIDRDNANVDVDQFEHRVEGGLAAFAGGESAMAAERLEQALSLYRGEFLADEPYAEWAFAERDRLRELAGRALRSLVEIEVQAHDLEAAAGHIHVLAEMEPFDTDVQRSCIALCLRRGRRSEARRRYSALRMRMLREFSEEPDFALSELTDRSSLALA